MTANYKENGSVINQLKHYARLLYEGGITEIYLILPVNIDDNCRKDVLSGDFCQVFTHSRELWQKGYLDRNAYIQVMPPRCFDCKRTGKR